MRPEDPIARNYDLSLLAGEVVRDEESKRLVNSLGSLFPDATAVPVAVGNGLTNIAPKVGRLIGIDLFAETSNDMSEPYDELEHDGVKLVSRIIRLTSNPNSRFFESSKIYLISLMGEGQATVTSKNCPLGVVKTQSGRIEYFKVEDNDNLGKLVVSRAVEDPESERVLTQEGRIDNEEKKLTTLSPEEQYMAVAEFEKALSRIPPF